LLAAGLALAAATPFRAETPGRVVSMNLCTDQLALMLADEGQLISVSDIAQDPLTSAMHREAAAYPINHGGAEEIFLLQPDLVLAGVWSDPTTVAMLRGLGIEVAQIDVANSLADVPGSSCGRSAACWDGSRQAEALIRTFETDLARLAGPDDGPRAAFYYPNGYTLGTGTLSHDIITHVGFTHIADELGRDTSGRVALELMVMATPDLVIGANPIPARPVRGNPAPPGACAACQEQARGRDSGPDWICGTPHVVQALAEMAGIRAEIETGQ
jgi:iron complex transport system substrate-binding protein